MVASTATPTPSRIPTAQRPASAGVVAAAHVITETPGTQSGAYCGSADLAITNTGTPPVVAPGGTIVYTQVVTNNGPLDAVNAVFSETLPANTTFQSLPNVAGWTCVTPAVGAAGSISCTNPDVAKSAIATFTLTVNVLSSTPNGTQIVDVANILAGTSDPNLSNNSATAVTTVGAIGTADLQVINTSSSPTTLAGSNVTMTAAVTNLGPSAASTVTFTEAVPANTSVATTFRSSRGLVLQLASRWHCCGDDAHLHDLSLAANANASFPLVLKVLAATPSGTVISGDANITSTTPDPNALNNESIATTIVATAGQSDLGVTSSALPNPVTQGNNITYTQSVFNNGPAAATAATFTDTIPTGTTLASFTPPANWTCNSIPVGGTGTITCTLNIGQTIPVNGTVSFPVVVNVNLATTAPHRAGWSRASGCGRCRRRQARLQGPSVRWPGSTCGPRRGTMLPAGYRRNS